jgi:hypothetical protein
MIFVDTSAWFAAAASTFAIGILLGIHVVSGSPERFHLPRKIISPVCFFFGYFLLERTSMRC